jgi:hypothetical protein
MIVWLLIMGLETIHGILRGLYLTPVIGQKTANLIGWPIGAGIVLTAIYLLLPWTGLRQPRDLLKLGIVWAVFTTAFEAAVGMARGLTVLQVADDFNPLSGGLGLYTVIFMLAAPWLGARLRQS